MCWSSQRCLHMLNEKLSSTLDHFLKALSFRTLPKDRTWTKIRQMTEVSLWDGDAIYPQSDPILNMYCNFVKCKPAFFFFLNNDHIAYFQHISRGFKSWNVIYNSAAREFRIVTSFKPNSMLWQIHLQQARSWKHIVKSYLYLNTENNSLRVSFFTLSTITQQQEVQLQDVPVSSCSSPQNKRVQKTTTPILFNMASSWVCFDVWRKTTDILFKIKLFGFFLAVKC